MGRKKGKNRTRYLSNPTPPPTSPQFSRTSRVSAPSNQPSPTTAYGPSAGKQKIQIAVAIIATLVAIASLSWALINAKKNSELNFINQCPQLIYSWRSNYKELAFAELSNNPHNVAKLLKSRFEIMNTTEQDLSDFNLGMDFGFDEDLFFRPDKELPVKSIPAKIDHLKNHVFARGCTLSCDIFEVLREAGMPLEILLPEYGRLYSLEKKDFYNKKYGELRNLLPCPKRSLVPKDTSHIWRALYFRIAVQYQYKTNTFVHFIYGRLGIGLSSESKGFNNAMYVSDYFYQNGYSIVTDNYGNKRNLLIRQAVNNDYFDEARSPEWATFRKNYFYILFGGKDNTRLGFGSSGAELQKKNFFNLLNKSYSKYGYI